MTLRIAVCAKQVPDPSGPPACYEVAEGGRVTTRGIAPVMNPFDENALEAAIRIKETGGARITLLSMGRRLSRVWLQKALASGADELLLLEDDALDAALLDSHATAALLAAQLEKRDGYDLIFCGRQASDTNSGQVGLGIAHLLGIPAVTLARSVAIHGDRVVVERELDDGCEVVTTPRPCLITVGGEADDLRRPSLSAMRAARSLPQTVLGAEDLDADVSVLRWVETVAVSRPRRERACAMVEAGTPEEAGRLLALELREGGVL